LLNFALHAAAKHPVGFISLESSRHELIERAFSRIGGIDGKALRTGTIRPADFKGLSDAAESMHKMQFYIADRPNMRIDELKSRARRMARQHGVKLILVDYIQLIQVAGQPSDYERVSLASLGLKALSRELEVPIIAAAQLNRGADEGAARAPRLSDFKGSGQIEQDADTAILIHRAQVGELAESTRLIVAKNRDGACDTVGVVFDKAKMRFTDAR
jgi:replicative DNA helicase